MTPPRVVLRADASARIGVGHVMRCTTLGDALARRGADVVLSSVDLPPPLAERATSAGLTVVAAADPLDPRHVVDLAPDLVVVDGYGLGPLVRSLAHDDVLFGVIDDNAELPVDGAAFVLNQNLHADASLYPGTPIDRLLLGPSWALLRRDVVAVAPIEMTDRPDPVLVAMGGADPLGLTLPITTGLLEAGLAVWVGVGAANPQRPALETLAAGEPHRLALDRGDLLAGYSAAALAVVGAGTTMWELAHLGIPGLAVIVADNQVRGAARAEDLGFLDVVDVRDHPDPAGVVVAATTALAADVARLRAMAAAGPVHFDGRGADRAAARLLQLLGPPT